MLPNYPGRVRYNEVKREIEIINAHWEDAGAPYLRPNESPTKPGPGQYRLTFERCTLHTQRHTVNNTLLSDRWRKTSWWINRQQA